MSLINEALKKAQKQRGAEVQPLSAMPSVGGEPAVQIARRGKSSGFPTRLVGFGIGAALLVGVIIGGVVLILRKPDAIPAQQPAIIAQTPAAKPPEAVAKVEPPKPTPIVVATTAPVLPATTAPAPVTQAPAKSEPPIVAKVDTPQPAPTPAPIVVAEPVPPKPEPVKPAAPLKLEPRAINFIESLRVAGIRASATDSKVLMNDRVYRIGSIIEHEMGIKLTGITANSLTFEDERGASYTRTF